MRGFAANGEMPVAAQAALQRLGTLFDVLAASAPVLVVFRKASRRAAPEHFRFHGIDLHGGLLKTLQCLLVWRRALLHFQRWRSEFLRVNVFPATSL
jgi:hypothetical protein